MQILRVENASKIFGDYKAVNDVSFSLEKGRILGLLGPNGAGKTTLIRMITNIYFPDEGEIFLFDKPISSELQNNIGYLPEERGLYKKLKVIDQLIYFGSLKGMSRSEASKAGKKWLKILGAAEWENKKIQELSKGMQQKIQFITTILHNPDFLILDEPFSGFDPVNMKALKDIILELKAEGKTIILSTHIMQQVEELCDDVCLINKGRLVLSGNVREIKKSFGKDTVLIEYDGVDTFLNELGLEFTNKSDGRAEFRLNNLNITPAQLLRKLSENLGIYRFELSEPSFNEIFIEMVKDKEVENA